VPRFKEILDRDALPEDKRHIHDYLQQTRGAVKLPFSAMLTRPELAYRVAHVGSFIRFESSLPDAVRELAILTAAHIVHARFEWYSHQKIGEQAGVSAAAITAIRTDAPLDTVPDAERLPIRVARELLTGARQLSADAFNDARSRYGDAGAADLIGTVGYYAMLGCLLNGLEIEPPASPAQ
jgi:4-carboxymuconolactone decarboxylase